MRLPAPAARRMTAVRDMGGVFRGEEREACAAPAPSAIRKIVADVDFFGEDGRGLSARSIPAPAKINLFLAVTGRRPDGFHDLVSVAVPLLLGDTIDVESGGDSFTVECDNREVPTDGSNLVIRAAAEFAKATGRAGGAHFRIAKRIPFGAGLGGASSDAASVLEALNDAAGGPLDATALSRVASTVGSDCALFLARCPVVMRGRGERVEPLAKEAYSRIRGMRVLVFKPGFAIPTPWAYGRLAAEAPRGYVAPSRAEAMLASWVAKSGAPAGELLFNSMERAAFAKFPALPVLLERLRSQFGIPARMSGSGSACFALLDEPASVGPVEAVIREAWGPSAFVVETRVA
jgi:4-diphosphocytidyl-2-C-methyl-D-erythritol kinase